MADRALPALPTVLRVQLGYHLRRVLRTPRALSTGALLPVLLLVVADPHGAAESRVAGLAVLGAGMTAWTTHGSTLVAAREAGELRRWRAMPVPRWCFLGARVAASVFAATLGGLATVLVGVVGYGVRLDLPSAAAAVVVLLLGSAAWAATATAITRLATSVETAWPILGLTYLPMVLTSGAVSDGAQPSWLRAITSLLPARPMVHALGAALGSGSFSIADIATLLVWTAAGLNVAALWFRWDPTPPRDAPGLPAT